MTFDEYAEAVDDKWKDAFLKTWETIETHLPPGFEVAVSHGMPGFQVPLEKYPEGYHVDHEPLPFIGIALKKDIWQCTIWGCTANPKFTTGLLLSIRNT